RRRRRDAQGHRVVTHPRPPGLPRDLHPRGAAMNDPLSNEAICDELLTPLPAEEASGLRRQVLERTTRALRRRRWARRLARAAALAACSLAGVLTVALRPGPAPAPQAETRPRPEAPPQGTPPVPSPRELEWTALESPDRQAERYREAGDRYLKDAADPQSAL